MKLDRTQRIDASSYTAMSPAELRRAARERIAHYSRPHPAEMAGTYALLRDAWEWVDRRHK